MTVRWVDGDVCFIDGDIEFVPQNVGMKMHTGHHGLISTKVLTQPAEWLIVVNNACHVFRGFNLALTTGGGIHDNTEHVIYNAHDYLRCKHTGGNLTGTYTSRIFDTGVAADRYLIYIVGQDTGEPDIVIIGEGTTWDAQVPIPTTWTDIDASSNSWTNIFQLGKGPAVQMRVYYGETSPPTNYVDHMEIFSAIVPDARYFRVVITIIDPVAEVYAYVEKYHLRLCQAS